MKNNILKVLKKELGTDLYENSCSLFEKAREGDLESLVAFVFIVNCKNSCFTFIELKELAKKLSKNTELKKDKILLLLTVNAYFFKDIIPNVVVNIDIDKKKLKVEKVKEPEYEEYSGCGYSGCR